MKNFQYTILIFASLLVTSCTKDFDPQITGVLSPLNFPQTEKEYESYALDCYRPFGSKWGYPGIQYENMFFSPEYGNLAMNDLSGDQFLTFTKWGGHWEGFSKADFTFLRTQWESSHYEKVRFITRMTKIIDDLQKSTTVSDEMRNLLIGEVRMSRGWTLFFLFNMYGPVPVILDATKIGTSAEADQTRPSEEFFVTAINGDLRFAADHLPVIAPDYGRFNKGLALGVLMRHYLQQKKWPEAEAAGREIMALKYSLVTNYAGLFKSATEKNNETIWAVSCDSKSTGEPLQGNFNSWSYYCYPNNMKGISTSTGWGPGVGVFCASWAFYDSFEPADVRRALLLPEYKTSFGKAYNRTNMPGAVVRKYPDEDGPQYQGNDVVVLRYADVLLMMAEAINNSNGPTIEAIDFVNQVRTRAGIGNLSSDETGSRGSFNDAILKERSHELFFEGLRRLDLVRFGKWRETLVAAGKIPGPTHLFPVPQYAIDVSNGKLIQTEGY